MANAITLHLRDDERPIVERAKKLAAFHDDLSLSRFFVKACQDLINKYDGEGK